ncbi:hypothetical protein [Anaerovibrio sp.]|uniref:hypothetical protein n=1 Tax=Anaerovibrio sp. TaxID=1872532 RepID=UPI00388DFE7E
MKKVVLTFVILLCGVNMALAHPFVNGMRYYDNYRIIVANDYHNEGMACYLIDTSSVRMDLGQKVYKLSSIIYTYKDDFKKQYLLEMWNIHGDTRSFTDVHYYWRIQELNGAKKSFSIPDDAEEFDFNDTYNNCSKIHCWHFMQDVYWKKK